MPLDFDDFDVLTFDCYGTLIDWEAGHPRRAAGAAGRARHHGDGRRSCSRRSRGTRRRSEAGPYRPYREVLGGGPRQRCSREAGGVATPDELAAFGGSVVDWPAFPDCATALARLHERFKLGVITNCDDDLFAASEARLGHDLRLGRHGPAGQALQAQPARLRADVRAGRAAAGPDPARRPEPVPRSRAPRSGSGCRPSGSIGAATDLDPARPHRPRRRPTCRVTDMATLAELAVPG